MQDAKLYEQILGLTEPWFVDRVELDVARQRVDLFVEHRPGATWQCPHCDHDCALYDHGPSRRWRHLDTCQLQTHLHARPPRISCDEHGVCNVDLPWAEANGRFTLMMERFVIDLLKHCQNITAARRLIGISWDQASHVMQRAVQRGLRRLRARERAHVSDSRPRARQRASTSPRTPNPHPRRRA